MIRFIDERGVIEPSETTGAVKAAVESSGATVAVTTFSNHLFDELIQKFGGKIIGTVKGGCDYDIYVLDVNGTPILAYKSSVGAPASVMAAEEIIACGIKRIVAFGICGLLKDLPLRSLIVPTRAYRDEGTSYHYAPASETIKLDNGAWVASELESYGLSVEVGADWCTDALYRETKTRLCEMRALGCISVDMECSALQAVCNYRDAEFYTFFISADSLASGEWEPNYILDVKLDTPDTVAVGAAVRLAAAISNK